LAQPF